MSEWIEHDGKSRPDLPSGALVTTRHSNGWTDESYKAHPSWEFWDEEDDLESSWIDSTASNPGYVYITHYRVVKS